MSGTPQSSGDGAALDWRPPHSPWIIALTVMLATFMEVLDTSIANVSLPHIAGNLSAGIDESTWVLTSYLVSNAIILPLAGWFSSIFGRKRFYSACVTIFVVSSFLCGLAPSLGWLVFFRILQGAGGGCLQPTSQAILVESFPRAKRGMAMAIYAMGVVVAPIVGPTVGGWITDNYTWRWIFFINIPVGALSLLMTAAFIQDPPYLKRRDMRTLKIDYVGLGLLVVGLGALQIMLDKGQRDDWLESNFIAVLLGLAVAGLAGAFIWEWIHKDPMVDLHLLKNRNFAVSTFTMFTLGFVLYGSTALLPIFLQTLLGYTATLSGLALSPGGLATMLVLPIAGRLLGRFEARWLVILGVAATAMSMFQMAGFSLDVDFSTVVWARCVTGVGLAFLFVPINTMAFYFVPRDKMNYGTGLINLSRNIGGSCGIAFVTTVLARGAQIHQNYLVANLSPTNPAFQAATQGAAAALARSGSGAPLAAQQSMGLIYGTVQRQAAMMSFADNFRTLGTFFLVLIPLMFLMKKAPPHTGEPLAAH